MLSGISEPPKLVQIVEFIPIQRLQNAQIIFLNINKSETISLLQMSRQQPDKYRY